jgi:hypothetical protein
MRLTNTIRVDATPEEAWRVVGDLTAVDKWIPGVVGARVDGARRVCTTADGGERRDDQLLHGRLPLLQLRPDRAAAANRELARNALGPSRRRRLADHLGGRVRAGGSRGHRQVEAAYREALDSLARLLA